MLTIKNWAELPALDRDLDFVILVVGATSTSVACTIKCTIKLREVVDATRCKYQPTTFPHPPNSKRLIRINPRHYHNPSIALCTIVAILNYFSFCSQQPADASATEGRLSQLHLAGFRGSPFVAAALPPDI